jgi:DNA-binding XRE family transcriptional regulator
VSEITKLTGNQLAAARALLALGQVELAKAANVSAPTLRRMESSKDVEAQGMKNNVAAVRAALESAGVEFIDGGVRLKP